MAIGLSKTNLKPYSEIVIPGTTSQAGQCIPHMYLVLSLSAILPYLTVDQTKRLARTITERAFHVSYGVPLVLKGC